MASGADPTNLTGWASLRDTCPSLWGSAGTTAHHVRVERRCGSVAPRRGLVGAPRAVGAGWMLLWTTPGPLTARRRRSGRT
jgi:hypothetical protein